MGAAKPISRTMLAFVVSVSTLLVNHGVAADTLQGAVHETLISNPDILSAKAKEQAAYQDILQARGAYFPSVDVAGGIGKQYSNNPFTRSTDDPHPFLVHKEAQIFINQLLYDGGNVSNTVAQRRFDWKTSEFQLAETRENLAFLTATAYLDVLRNRELVGVSERSVASHQQTLNDVSRLLKGGAGLRSDLELAQGRLARSKADLDITRQALANSELTYIKLVGTPIPPVMEPPIVPSNMPNSLRQAEEVAAQSNPAIQAALAQMNAATAAVGVAKSVFYPTFSLDINSSYNNNVAGVVGDDHETQAMLRMRYNLFHGGSDVAAEKSAIEQQRAAQYTIASVQRDVGEQVGIAWNLLETSKATIPEFKKYSADSLDVFRAYQKQYQLGQRTLFDLLDAETEHYDALKLYINARYDEKTAHYQLLSTMGNLVSTMAYSHLDKPDFALKEEPLVTSEVMGQDGSISSLPDSGPPIEPLPLPPNEPFSSTEPQQQSGVSAELQQPVGPSTEPQQQSGVTPESQQQAVPSTEPQQQPGVTPESQQQAAPSTESQPQSGSSMPAETQSSPNNASVPETMSAPKPAETLPPPLSEPVSPNNVLPSQPATSSPPVLQQQTKTTPLVNQVVATTAPSQTANNGGRYTIQLLASKDKSALDSFIDANNLKGKVQYYKTVVDGQEWFRLVYGDYDSPEAAWGSLDTIPHSLQNFEPLVRSFASVRGEENVG